MFDFDMTKRLEMQRPLLGSCRLGGRNSGNGCRMLPPVPFRNFWELFCPKRD